MKYKTELKTKAQISKISKADIKLPFELVKSANDSFIPSDEIIKEVQKGLEWRKKYNRGGTKLALSQAKDLINNPSLSLNMIKRMNAFFIRNKNIAIDNKADPTDEQIAWALWGGDYAKEWVSQIVEKENLKTKASELLDPDLLKMTSILVSQGMNLNDDVFLKEELVKARLTGANKPLNIEHQDTEIIGHMLRSYVLSKDGKELEDLEDIDLEDEIDVANEAVVYAMIFPEVAAKIEELASKNELFVSVEAWFSEYDYVLGNKIIKRTAATSEILDKHLRINGGGGIYQDKKVGRVLRNIMFGGIGVVASPANPESVILEVGNQEKSTASEDELFVINTIGNINLKEEGMDVSKVEQNSDSKEELKETIEVVESTENKVVENTETVVETVEAAETSIEEKLEDVVSNETSLATEEKAEPVIVPTAVIAEGKTTEANSVAVTSNSTSNEFIVVGNGMWGVHDHPELMDRILVLEGAIGTLGSMLSRHVDLVIALEQKIKILETEALIAERHKMLVEAGLSSEIIASRLDKVSSMSKEEFNTYIIDIKEIIGSSEAKEQIEEKEETISVEASVIDLSKIETDSVIEIGNNSSKEGTSFENALTEVLTGMFPSKSKRKIDRS